jgi:hypothetical protein
MTEEGYSDSKIESKPAKVKSKKAVNDRVDKKKTNCRFKEIDLGINEITGKRETRYIIDKGPKTICYFFIFLIIAGTIISIAFPPQSIKEDKKTIYYVSETLHGIITAGFMYYMCYICRGIMGFIILILFNIFYWLVLSPALYT